MASLIKILRDQGFDYIDGSIRNHQPLQVWNKKNLDKNTFYDMLSNLFVSSVELIQYEAPALFVNYSSNLEYNLNVGITVLEELLKSANFGELGLEAKLKSGKSVSISFNNAKTIEYAKGNISNYFFDKNADFKSPNRELLFQANRDNLLLISGLLYAQNLEVHIKTTKDIDAKIGIELTEIAKGKADFTLVNSNELVMKSDLGLQFPIAVKAFRLIFDKGKYQSMRLVTDNRNFF